MSRFTRTNVGLFLLWNICFWSAELVRRDLGADSFLFSFLQDGCTVIIGFYIARKWYQSKLDDECSQTGPLLKQKGNTKR